MKSSDMQNIVAVTATKSKELAGGSIKEQVLSEDNVLVNFILRVVRNKSYNFLRNQIL